VFNNKIKFIQFMRFCTVGLVNTAVDCTAFFILTSGGVPYLLAQVLSYSAGVINSFFLNRQWTFQVTRKANSSEFTKFIIVNGFSLLISAGLLFILHDVNHLDLWLSKLAATGGSIVVNYTGSRIWVFAKKQTITGDAL
jgi:putative flippase GtrA